MSTVWFPTGQSNIIGFLIFLGDWRGEGGGGGFSCIHWHACLSCTRESNSSFLGQVQEMFARPADSLGSY